MPTGERPRSGRPGEIHLHLHGVTAILAKDGSSRPKKGPSSPTVMRAIRKGGVQSRGGSSPFGV